MGNQVYRLSPDRHALQTSDGLEQLLQVGPNVQCPLNSKRTFIVNQCPM